MELQEKNGVQWVNVAKPESPEVVMEFARQHGAVKSENGVELFVVKPEWGGLVAEEPYSVNEQELRELLDTSKGLSQ